MRAGGGIALASLAWLSACEVGPNYVRPALTLPANWHEQQVTEAQARQTAASLQDWWTGFHDAELDRLVDQAVSGNLSLDIGRTRIRGARAERRAAGAAAYPQIGASAGAGLANSSTTLQYPPGIGEYRTYDAGFDASWEIDVFGGTKRAEEAADAEIEASLEDQRATLVSLLSELALDYAMLRSAQARIRIAEANLKVARQAADLTNTAFDRGLTSSLATAQSTAQVKEVQSGLPPLRAEVARLAHAIALLLGRFPGELEAELSVPAPAMPVPPALPLSLPSEVVANRPDIRAAERHLAAASARIGAALSRLYPHFTIPLGLTPQTSFLSTAFDASSLVWSVGLSVSQSITSGGRLPARVEQARAVADSDRLAYQQTVLSGFREVEDALVTLRTETERGETLRAAVADNRLATDRARTLYEAGLTDFLNVLVTERALYAAEDEVALSDLARVRSVIALYKALGGGWQAARFAEIASP